MATALEVREYLRTTRTTVTARAGQTLLVEVANVRERKLLTLSDLASYVDEMNQKEWSR